MLDGQMVTRFPIEIWLGFVVFGGFFILCLVASGWVLTHNFPKFSLVGAMLWLLAIVDVIYLAARQDGLPHHG